LKIYFDKRILSFRNLTGILIQKKTLQQLLILDKDGWRPAEGEDYQDLSPAIKAYVPQISNLNNVVGFVTDFKSEYRIFKVKIMTKKRNKGARCDQAGKGETIKLLNMIEERTEYTIANTKMLSQKYLCVLQEFILRINNYKQKNSKIWFLDPLQSSLLNIEKLDI